MSETKSALRALIDAERDGTLECECPKCTAQRAATDKAVASAEAERARWKSLAMQSMRFLTAEQIAEACAAAGVPVTICAEAGR